MQFGGQPTPWSETEIEGLRLRSVSQILIQEIGADGPENAEDSARRACGVIQRQADQIVSADARIAELECGLNHLSAAFDADQSRVAELEREIERLDAQWRDELRIYRESEDARIAGLEEEVSRLRADAERWRKLRAMNWTQRGAFAVVDVASLKLGTLTYTHDRLDAAIDAARANGGEG